ncbi:MAG: F0F1 ATP synthase subunit A [Pseudodesulfovibrio sp.]|nr:F0F1 ATP synthase subunit A [Pseudodesulfovibrio sp.]
MAISPDHIIFYVWRGMSLNATLLFSWVVMVLLVVFSWSVTRRLSSDTEMGQRQNLLESVVSVIATQIRDTTNHDPEPFLPFLGTLFLFIAVSNTLPLIPGFVSPSGSLSTTAALALCVFVAVPYFGIRAHGVRNYLRSYLLPSPLMLPFVLVGEISRTFALAVRLFGNIMSGTMMGAILMVLAPLFVPVLMQLFGLFIGVLHAYIFSVLAAVFIAAGIEAHDVTQRKTAKE